MASRILSIIAQVLVGALLVFVFGALVMKYFFNDELHTLPGRLFKNAVMEVRYRGDVSAYPYHPQANSSSPRSHTTNVPILLYHGIANTPYKTDVLTAEFKDQLYTLKKAGYRTITLQEFEDYMQGKRDLPDKSFMITFDDGIKTSFYNTDPVLRTLNYTAVMFLISKYNLLDRHPYYLTLDELKQVQQTGRWELEAHATDGHSPIVISENGTEGNFLANKKWLSDETRFETDEEYRQRIDDEFTLTKAKLENGLNLHITAYAYPFGNFGQESDNYPDANNVVWSAAHNVYPYTFYQWWSSKGFRVNYPDPDEYRIRRIIVYPDTTGEELLTQLERTRDKDLPYYDELSTNNGWMVTWGNTTQTAGTLIMRQVNVSPGSMAFLEGTRLWNEYTFTANVRQFTGKNAGLLGMYHDNDNYLMCDFAQDAVRVRQVTDNQTVILAMTTQKELPYELPDANFTLSMRIADHQAICSINGEPIAETPIEEKPGGIGFRVSEKPEENGADPGTLVIDSLSVTPVEFADTFDDWGVLDDASSIDASESNDWWLNSGGAFIRQNGVGSTLQGESSPNTKWQLDYASYNPNDTANGAHPQNIFRLITRSSWQNIRQEVDFRIVDYHADDSPHRNDSNGVLLFSRYQDSDDLYYAGVRVDGAAVIKKKINGEYHELAYQNAFPGVYDLQTNPNLIPTNTWMGLRTDTVTLPDGRVDIKVYLDRQNTGSWQLIAEAVDDDTKYGPQLTEPGHAGIRTDFMDAEFDNYRITTID